MSLSMTMAAGAGASMMPRSLRTRTSMLPRSLRTRTSMVSLTVRRTLMRHYPKLFLEIQTTELRIRSEIK
nr:hypothetical protein CFP56_37560 [Quercus suber]